MAHVVRIDSIPIRSLRHRVGELRSALTFWSMAVGDDEDHAGRLAEAQRLIKLAEELYERADALVKQAEELLPPDDLPSEAAS